MRKEDELYYANRQCYRGRIYYGFCLKTISQKPICRQIGYKLITDKDIGTICIKHQQVPIQKVPLLEKTLSACERINRGRAASLYSHLLAQGATHRHIILGSKLPNPLWKKSGQDMERKRDKQINIRLTVDEYLKVYSLMEKSDLCLSEYIRKSILGKEIKIVSGIKELIWELNRIGNNLNQLARKVNEGKVVELGDNLSQLNCNLNNVFEKIVKIL